MSLSSSFCQLSGSQLGLGWLVYSLGLALAVSFRAIVSASPCREVARRADRTRKMVVSCGGSAGRQGEGDRGRPGVPAGVSELHAGMRRGGLVTVGVCP